MKTWRKMSIVRLCALTALFLAASNLLSRATTNEFRYSPSLIPIFTNNPTAMYVITNLMAAPRPALSVPEVSQTNNSVPGAVYWMFSTPAPLPFDPYPDLPVYQVSTNSGTNYGPAFIIDDRSVDYGAMTNDLPTNTFTANALTIDTNSLYLEVATNSTASNQFNVLIINTTNGDFYDVLTKTDLLLPTWTVENTVTGAVGNITPVTLSQDGRTNLFLWARTATIIITTQPLSQEVLDGDTVTFTVGAGGVGLTYQWTLNGTPIYGATGSSYTINAVDYSQAGDYACIITGAAGSVTSQAATLTVDNGSGDPNQMTVLGQRQDYTFHSGVTYYIAETIQLYGNTTFEAGTIVKFDYYGIYPSLQVLGVVTCKGVSYNPSVLTTVDDDAFGEQWSYGPPQSYFTGVPYLDLSEVTDNVALTNLWFRYADAAVATPAGGQLDVWNGQFFQCNASILNEFGGVDSLHNVLFAGCQTAVAADTNSFAVSAENITADVVNLCTASNAPTYVCLTNSIVTGNANGATLQNSVVGPDPSNFETNGSGNYYLAAGSALHQSGTTNISAELLKEFCRKTTYAPIALVEFMSLAGNLTLSPQVQRYTNGAPDKGYYYDALDYTVAAMTNNGSITVLPGTAIGFREDLNTGTLWGFDLREASSFMSHGMPTKPIIFTDVQWVQEQFANPCFADFVPDFQGATNTAAPIMDFRFCNFYPATGWYHVWAGQDANSDYMASYNSVVNWTMRDCNLHGGQISLGEPDNGNFYGIPYTTFYGVGAVAWDNNLFENVAVNLQPTYDWYDGTINVDLAFSAYNNLFHNSSGIVLAPVPASAGNWTFEDNLFDQVNIFQSSALPLDYDYNGYWPLTTLQLQPGYASQLQTTTTGDGFTDGGNEQVLSSAPPYVHSVYGDYYLSTMTSLYEAGSRTATDAGLAQYTTFSIQAKDNSGSAVNIGLHYVAATNNVPFDSDGDGIPDYVEAEHGTDLNNATTDGMTNDIYNAAYDDVDLSGNGLVGRIKAALGINPLDPNNPLELKQVITGEEPDFATFEVPVSYNAVMSSGTLNVNMNGIDVTLEECNPATNGNCLLSFNVAFDPAGSHYLSAGFRLANEPPPELHPVMTASGAIQPFVSSNSVQFFEANTMFDNTSAYLDAKISVPEADYQIELFNPDTTPPTLLTTITNTTTSGFIQEEWGLTNDDGSTYSGASIEAAYTVTPANTPSITPTFHAHRTLTRATNSLSEWGPNFDVAYFYTPTNGAMAYEFAQDGAVWNGMLGVVDTLTMPDNGYDVYNSYFNHYFCYYCGDGQQPYPGYITSRSMVTNNLLSDMANGLTKSFYGYGHGNSNYIGNYTASAYMSSYDVSRKLQNAYAKRGGLVAQNPYRFVWLDGCSTTSGKDWRRAFGIYPLDVTNNIIRSKVGPQAYVGWADVHTTRFGFSDDSTFSVNLATAGAQTLDNFYAEWMNKVPLVDCIYDATKSTYGAMPLLVPENKNIHVSGPGYNYYFTNMSTSKIYLIGFPGLKVNTTDHSYDPNTTYAAPKNVE